MLRRLRRSSEASALRLRSIKHRSTVVSFLALSLLPACSDGGEAEPGDGASGGSGGSGGSGFAGNAFNQCGVAAPLPTETGQCTPIGAPTIADFDDFAGTDATSYTFRVAAAPPAEPVQGAILHVGDGSDANGGTSVIATEMVTGEGDAGYAVQISNTNAASWGGLLMFYFPFGGTPLDCMDARNYSGVEFSIRGSAASGRFGVTLGMLDTVATAENGLCTNPTASDCKDANVQMTLPADPETWLDVQVPWGVLTPGIGSNTACVPVTGQNIMRLVIQPFMNYPPPDFMLEPGPYSIAVDNLRFY